MKTLRSFFLLLLLIVTENISAQNVQTKDSTKSREEVVNETKPKFRGGDEREFIKWLYFNIKLPYEISSNGITGVSLVSFMVDSTGKVVDISVVKSLHSELDKVLIETIRKSPKWKPGLINNKRVNVRYILPFTVKYK